MTSNATCAARTRAGAACTRTTWANGLCKVHAKSAVAVPSLSPVARWIEERRRLRRVSVWALALKLLDCHGWGHRRPADDAADWRGAWDKARWASCKRVRAIVAGAQPAISECDALQAVLGGDTGELRRIAAVSPLAADAIPGSAPEPRCGQVWVWRCPLNGTSVEAMVGGVGTHPEGERRIAWSGIPGNAACPDRDVWPPLGAVLVAGPGAPWAPVEVQQ